MYMNLTRNDWHRLSSARPRPGQPPRLTGPPAGRIQVGLRRWQCRAGRPRPTPERPGLQVVGPWSRSRSRRVSVRGSEAPRLRLALSESRPGPGPPRHESRTGPGPGLPRPPRHSGLPPPRHCQSR